MDPALRQVLAAGGDDVVEAIIQIEPSGEAPPGVRIIARFGDIATCRLPRERVAEVWADDDVVSLKAPRVFGIDPEPDVLDGPETSDEAIASLESDVRRPEGLQADGRGVIVAAVDWGFDFAHPNFRNPDGTTRIKALWDQMSRGPGVEPYGYGKVHERADIDTALRTAHPYETLGYHPGDGDPTGRGAHGTHVLDIAAGNGQAPGAPKGIACGAEFLLVNLATRGTGGQANLGDSVTLLEALDWIRKQAGDTPFVCNLSVGRHGGPHNGLTLVERGIDSLLVEAPGRCIVQSTGNYFSANVHAGGQLRPGQTRQLHWITDQADITPNELEVWYSEHDVMGLEVQGPGDLPRLRVPLGGDDSIVRDGQELVHVYHRAKDPAGGNHIDIFLDRSAPAGTWAISLIAEDIVDGRYHAWVERDAACLKCQSRLSPDDALATTSTGTVCNGFRSVVVGSYSAHDPDRPLAHFSSSGPTVDGRVKPDLVAPGVRVLAARSAAREENTSSGRLTRMSGTSMAAPHVTGTVACIFEAAGRPLNIRQTRQLLLSSAEPLSAEAPAETRVRGGSGYLDIEMAVHAALSAREAPEAAVAPHHEALEAVASGPSELSSDGFDDMDDSPESNALIPAEEDFAVGQEQDSTNEAYESWPESDEDVVARDEAAPESPAVRSGCSCGCSRAAEAPAEDNAQATLASATFVADDLEYAPTEELDSEDDLSDRKDRIDQYFEEANAEYDLGGGTKVRARPQFRYAKAGGFDEATRQLKSALGATTFSKHRMAIHNALYGRAKPSEIKKITQALIDAGELDQVRKDNSGLSDKQLVRKLQRKFKIGIDCAGYVQLAFIFSLKGSDNDTPKVRTGFGLHEKRGWEKLASLPSSHFKKVKVLDGQTGDLFVFSPRAGDADRAWHTVIIVEHSVSGTVHTFLVDASWGTDLYGENAGGVGRRKLKHDTSTGTWWDIHPIDGTKAHENNIGPYNGHPIHGMYRSKQSSQATEQFSEDTSEIESESLIQSIEHQFDARKINSGESLVGALLEHTGAPGLRGAHGGPCSVAELFDGLAGFLGPAVKRHFGESFSVIGAPGEPLPELPLPGDLHLVRPLAEGGLARTSAIVRAGESAGSGEGVDVVSAPLARVADQRPVTRRRLRRNHHVDRRTVALDVRLMPRDQMIIRVRNGRMSSDGETVQMAEDEPAKPQPGAPQFPVSKLCPTLVSVAVHGSDPDTHKIPSVLPAAKKPLDHFVTALSVGGNVVLVATLSPAATACKEIKWEAVGATITSPAVGTNRCTAKIARAASKRIPVQIKCDNRVLWQGVLWIVSARANPLIVCLSSDVGLTIKGDGTVAQAMAITARPPPFRFDITPPEIIVHDDRPNLEGANSPGVPIPSGTSTHVMSARPLSGGVDHKWDESRRVRIKILNPHLYAPADLPNFPGHMWKNQPKASEVPEDFPVNKAVGNDDTATTDPEDNDPYTVPEIGSLTGSDSVVISMPPDSTGKDGDTFEMRVHFGEFARLELGTKWYAISDFNPWKIHALVRRDLGSWTDNGTIGAANNTGF